MSEKKYGYLFHEIYKLYSGDMENISNPNWMTQVTNTRKIKNVYRRQSIKNYLPFNIANIKKSKSIRDFEYGQELIELINQHDGLLKLKELNNKNTDHFYWQLYTFLRLTDTNNSVNH